MPANLTTEYEKTMKKKVKFEQEQQRLVSVGMGLEARKYEI